MSIDFNQDFFDEDTDRKMKEFGLVFCCTCQKFIDDENHNINHVFAHSIKEINEKSVIEKLDNKIEKDA